MDLPKDTRTDNERSPADPMAYLGRPLDHLSVEEVATVEPGRGSRPDPPVRNATVTAARHAMALGSFVGRHGDDPVLPVLRYRHFDFGCSWPASAENIVRQTGTGSEKALVNQLHPVRPMLPQSQPAFVIRRELDSRSPTEPFTIAVHLFDRHIPIDPGDPRKLLFHKSFFESPLVVERDVLPVASTTSSRSGKRARWFNPVRRSFDDLQCIGPQERLRFRGHLNTHLLSG
jgi:hypothetical protein